MSNRLPHEVQLAVRAPKSMLEALDALVPELHASRADAVRAAINHYLYRLACEQDAERYKMTPLTEDELAPLGDSDNWENTPKW